MDPWACLPACRPAYMLGSKPVRAPVSKKQGEIPEKDSCACPLTAVNTYTRAASHTQTYHRDPGYIPESLGSERPALALQLPLWHCAQRMFASQTEGELKVTQVLKEKFPRATAIQVTDISGGCGAMYEIKIESEEFKEKRTVQQHQMVNQALKEEIKGMHGLRIFTSVPKC